ncbi:MAG: hypothetical protein PVF15_01420 [Candidatus Bathyarchaeota archaeon]|jgi:hypothetical protein
MIEKSEKKKSASEEAEEIRQILSAISTEVPGLLKSIVGAVFSEEAGRNMGRAAAAFYNELKESGIPDNVAVKMTEDYIGVFTSLGDLLKQVGKEGKGFISIGKDKEIEERLKEKLAEKHRRKEEEE